MSSNQFSESDKFEKFLKDFVDDLNDRPELVFAIAFFSLCFEVGTIISMSIDSLPETRSIVNIVAVIVVALSSSRVIYIFRSKRSKVHVARTRRHPYTFTLWKSILQVLVLWLITSMDDYLKEKNGYLVIVSLVAIYIHVVGLFFAFHIGEDCDVVTSLLAVSFALIYELYQKNIIIVICLCIAATAFLWIKNLLFLMPPQNPEDEDVNTAAAEDCAV